MSVSPPGVAMSEGPPAEGGATEEPEGTPVQVAPDNPEHPGERPDEAVSPEDGAAGTPRPVATPSVSTPGTSGVRERRMRNQSLKESAKAVSLERVRSCVRLQRCLSTRVCLHFRCWPRCLRSPSTSPRSKSSSSKTSRFPRRLPRRTGEAHCDLRFAPVRIVLIFLFQYRSIVDSSRLLSVLANGSTGRNPTFFKAAGHDDVFGLRSDLPRGASTMEVDEGVPSQDCDGAVSTEKVLYAQLPEGHPVITRASSTTSEGEEGEEEDGGEGGRTEEAAEAAVPDSINEGGEIETCTEEAEVVQQQSPPSPPTETARDVVSEEASDPPREPSPLAPAAPPVANASGPLESSLSIEEAIEQAEFIFEEVAMSEENADPEAGMREEEEDDEEEEGMEASPGAAIAASSVPPQEAMSPKSTVDMKSVCEPIEVDVGQEVASHPPSSSPAAVSQQASRISGRLASSPSAASAPPSKRVSPRISPRIQIRQQRQKEQRQKEQQQLKEAAASDAVDGRTRKSSTSQNAAASPVSPAATSSSPAQAAAQDTASRHNLRPKRTLRHVAALKQQAKRRKRNTSVATGNTGGSPSSQRTLSGGGASGRRSSVTSNGDIEIHYRPSPRDLQSHPGRQPSTMKEVLASLPGFPPLNKLRPQSASASSSSSGKKSGNKKMSASAALQQVREGSVDLESPDSILTQVSLRGLLNKGTFLRLPPAYQFRLLQLLPQVDNVSGQPSSSRPTSSTCCRLSQSGLNNEFFAKACQEWREQLGRGELTAESVQRSRTDSERERGKMDPWKAKHFEPIWGQRKDYDLSELCPDETVAAVLDPGRRRRRAQRGANGKSSSVDSVPDDQVRFFFYRYFNLVPIFTLPNPQMATDSDDQPLVTKKGTKRISPKRAGRKDSQGQPESKRAKAKSEDLVDGGSAAAAAAAAMSVSASMDEDQHVSVIEEPVLDDLHSDADDLSSTCTGPTLGAPGGVASRSASVDTPPPPQLVPEMPTPPSSRKAESTVALPTVPLLPSDVAAIITNVVSSSSSAAASPRGNAASPPVLGTPATPSLRSSPLLAAGENAASVVPASSSGSSSSSSSLRPPSIHSSRSSTPDLSNPASVQRCGAHFFKHCFEQIYYLIYAGAVPPFRKRLRRPLRPPEATAAEREARHLLLWLQKRELG